MITVTLLKGEPGSVRIEEGTVDFRGVRVTRADGTTKVPLDANSQPVRFSYECNPSDIIREDEALRIAEALSRNEVRGTLDSYEWRMC
jgi:hypothetical protein